MVVRWKTFSTCYLSALSANKADVYGKNFNKLMICIYQWENYDVMTLKYDKLFDNIIWGESVPVSSKKKCYTMPDTLIVSTINPIALRKAKIAYNFGLSECIGVKSSSLWEYLHRKSLYWFLPPFSVRVNS